MHLRRRIEKYLKASGVSAARFGRVTARDPRLVFDIRNGRMLGRALSARIEAYLDAHEGHLPCPECGR